MEREFERRGADKAVAGKGPVGSEWRPGSQILSGLKVKFIKNMQTLNTKSAALLLGKKGTIRLGGLTIEVEIQDVKVSYGRNRYLVSPLSGAGEIWVESIDGVEINRVTSAS